MEGEGEEPQFDRRVCEGGRKKGRRRGVHPWPLKKKNSGEV